MIAHRVPVRKRQTFTQVKAIHGQPCGSEKVNTCNAWGFGGWYGTRYTFDDGYSCEVGRYSTLHQGTHPRPLRVFNPEGEEV
jgi:hypothetical protein